MHIPDPLITTSPDRLSGTPVFAGTRVPVQTLIDYLEAGDTLAGLFDVLVTVDKSLPKQQRVHTQPFGVVVLRAKTNRLTDLLPLVSALRAAVEELRPGEVRELAG